MFLQRLDRARPELLVVKLAARRADDPEIVRQQAVGVQAVERGQQHAMRQVAGRAEQQQGRNLVRDHSISLAVRKHCSETIIAQRRIAERQPD